MNVLFVISVLVLLFGTGGGCDDCGCCGGGF